MPKQIILAIRSDGFEIPFIAEWFDSLKEATEVKEIFGRLIDEVLIELKGEDKRKTLAMMLFNNVDDGMNKKLKVRYSNTVAVQNYMVIVEKYPRARVEKAKTVLIEGVLQMMNEDWIVNKASNARFLKNERHYQIVLEKYMRYFKKELIRGCINLGVEKEEVLEIPSSIEGRGFWRSNYLNVNSYARSIFVDVVDRETQVIKVWKETYDMFVFVIVELVF